MAHYDRDDGEASCPNCGYLIQKTDTSKVGADSEIAKSVAECLGRAWDNENHADFTVCVGSQSFKCHKFILGACSEFFAALLRSNMQEKATGTATVEGMMPETFKLILDAIYKGQSILDVNNMLDVWQGAHQLQIEFLIKASEDFIVRQISMENYVDLYQVAILLESHKVKDAIHTLMIDNFSSVMTSETFPGLPPDCLLVLVSSGNLRESKDDVVDAILAWVRGPYFGERFLVSLFGDEETVDTDKWRQDHLVPLLEAVNLEEVSNHCVSVLMSDQTVLSCVKALRMVSRIGAKRLNGQRHY